MAGRGRQTVQGIQEYQLATGQTRYRARWKETSLDGTSSRRSASFVTRQEAEDHIIGQMRSASQGPIAPSKAMRLSEYMWSWIDEARLADSTRETYKVYLRCWVDPLIGSVWLGELDARTLRRFYRKLEQGGWSDASDQSATSPVKGPLAPSSVKRVATMLQSGLNAAIKDRLIRDNPACASESEPPRPKDISAKKKPVRFWEAHQLVMFLDWLDEQSKTGLSVSQRPAAELRDAVELAAQTGLRRGELSALTWSMITSRPGSDGLTLSVTNARVIAGSRIVEKDTKAGKPRAVTGGQRVGEILERIRSRRQAEGLAFSGDAKVFCRRDGTAYRPDYWLKTLVRRQDQYSQSGREAIPQITFHGLRHTHASLLLRSKVPIKVVSQRLGHANPTVTMGTYSHVVDDLQLEAAQALDHIWDGGAAT